EPQSERSSVMCRSTNDAPRATAPYVVASPTSCPEYPIGTPGKRAANVSIILRLSSAGGQGYVDVECARRSRDVPTTATDASISSCVDIPLESMIGMPVSAMQRSNE